MKPVLDDFQVSLSVINASGLLWTVSSRVWSVFSDEKYIFSEGYFRVSLMKTAVAVFDLDLISFLAVSSLLWLLYRLVNWLLARSRHPNADNQSYQIQITST